MPTFEIICLAKSTKLGGICIAGIKTDGSGWLRPVSDTEDGTLYPEHYTLQDGSEPQVFDIIRIPCVRPKPKCHQPENWIIDSRQTWKIVSRLTLIQAQELLSPEICKNSSFTELLGSSDNEICYENLEKSHADSSLALVKPREMRWQITSYDNQKKFRVIFSLGKIIYDLPITDPFWKSQIEKLECGKYSSEEIINILELDNFEPDTFLLTISLGEPFIPKNREKQFCYKLVAAVINVGDVKKRFGWD